MVGSQFYLKGKGGKYHNNAFEAQPTKHRIQNRQKGAPQWDWNHI